MIDLSGKVALVTGGSRGIGRACAVRLAEAGADVVVNYRTARSAAAATAEEVRRLGRRAVTVKADVSEAEDVRAMVEFVGERFGGLDVLVSNAATGGFRPLRDVTPAQFDAAMHTNVRALLYLIQASRDLLGRDRGGDRGRAKVVALSSHGSRLALPDYGMIGASKAALESLVRQLSREFGNSGINFNVVLAGPVETDSTRALPDAENLFRGSRERMLTSGAALTVDPVADAVLFLASGLSDFVQGQTIVVDGGLGVAG